MKIPQYIQIQYIDSNMQQVQDSEVIKPQIINACGYLIKQETEYITIALEVMETSLGVEYRNQLSIPRVAIITNPN